MGLNLTCFCLLNGLSLEWGTQERHSLNYFTDYSRTQNTNPKHITAGNICITKYKICHAGSSALSS